MLVIVLSLLVSGYGDDGLKPWEPAEHRILADGALRAVLDELGDQAPAIPGRADGRLTMQTEIWNGRDFGRLTAALAEDDASASRHQRVGSSVFEQLAEISAEDLESFRERVAAHHGQSGGSTLIVPNSGSAIVNYLQAHLAAVWYASEVGSGSAADQEAFFLMLAYESIAQGFLADVHAAGHMMVPRHDALQALHPVNNRHAHHHHNTEGLFVVNGRHEAWETFGDGMLTWYARSYRQVQEACVVSLREVFLAYYAGTASVPDTLNSWVAAFTDRLPGELVESWLGDNSGDAFYSGPSSLPSLSYIPMPVSATWSIRSDATDVNGVRTRRHYPQFVEQGYHDPNLPSAIRSRLYSRDSFPERFVPAALRTGSTPAATADTSQDAASVEFFNAPTATPDYAGLTTGLGFGLLTMDDGSAPVLAGTIGYGIVDNILIATQVFVNIGIKQSLDDDFVSPVSASLGLNPGGLPFRTEIGYVTTTDDFLSESGLVLGGKLNVASAILGFTYVGMTVRLGYEAMFLDDVLHVSSISIAFY